jgi:hypothetical protein
LGRFGGLVGSYVVHGQFQHFDRLGLMLTAPIRFVLVLLLGIQAANAHDLHIAEIPTAAAIRMFISHSKLLFLFGQ